MILACLILIFNFREWFFFKTSLVWIVFHFCRSQFYPDQKSSVSYQCVWWQRKPLVFTHVWQFHCPGWTGKAALMRNETARRLGIINLQVVGFLMAGEEAPGATSLCLILYLFTWPSPNIGSHTKDTVVQKSVYLPAGNWIIFRIHRHRIHACQGGSLLNSFRENPVLIFTVTVGDRPLLRLTSCGFTFEIQLTCSKLPRLWDWAGVFPGKPRQVQYFCRWIGLRSTFWWELQNTRGYL